MQRGKVNVLIDGQWGSTGKGKLAGILALKHNPELAICNYMTNAGHTWVPDEESRRAVMVQQLPSALISPKTLLHIASTAAIDPKVFDDEITQFDPEYRVIKRLSVDPRAVIINKSHKDAEAAALHSVSSTVKGCGAATADKVMRRNVTIEGEINSNHGEWHGAVVVDTEKVVGIALANGWKILFETAQGFDLSLDRKSVV